MNAGSVGGTIPGVRVTWNTTVPPECVKAMTVEFRLISSRGPVVATYTTTNTSQTEVIPTGLHCGTSYYTRVVVTGETSDGLHPTLSSRQVQVLVEGKWFLLATHRNLDDGYVIVLSTVMSSQIYQSQLEWKLKSLLTTQVSECRGSGYVRVCLTFLEWTINLREALG